MAAPQPPPPLPEGLTEIWFHYEYFKRTLPVNINERFDTLMRGITNDVRNELIDAWNADTERNREPSAKRAKNEDTTDEDESDKEMEIVSEESDDEETPITPDGFFINLESIIASQPPPISITPIVQNPEYKPHSPDKQVIDPNTNRDFWNEEQWDLFDKFGKNEVKKITKNGDSLKEKNTLDMLAIRDFSKFEVRKLVDKYKFPLETLKVITGIERITIEIYSNPEDKSKKPLYLQFWHQPNGCFIWHGSSLRIVPDRSYCYAAAENIFVLLKHPKTGLKELCFDVEPFYKDEKEYPDMRMYEQMLLLFDDNVENGQIRTRNLFLRMCRGPQFYQFQLEQLLKYFRPKYLKMMELRVWDDSKLIECRRRNDEQLEKYTFFLSLPFEHLRRAWSPTHLDVRDKNIENDFEEWTNFLRIKTYQIDHHSVSDIIRAFQMYPPRRKCVISADFDLKMPEIKYILENSPVGGRIRGCRYIYQSSIEKTSIVIRFEKDKVVVEAVSTPGANFDDESSSNSSAEG